MVKKFELFTVEDVAELWLDKNRKVHTVFWHCSASDRSEHDAAEVMERWHREKGWSGIGYHGFLKKNGDMQMGRSWDRIPAAQEGYNYGTLAFCLHGLAKDRFTTDQLDSMYNLSSALTNMDPGLRFRGHREVSPKLCPVVDYKAILGLDSAGYMVTPSTVQNKARARPTLLMTHSGEDVKDLQMYLNARGANLEVDGHFGRLTYVAVTTLQQHLGLVSDGIVGPLTWRALEG